MRLAERILNGPPSKTRPTYVMIMATKGGINRKIYHIISIGKKGEMADTGFSSYLKEEATELAIDYAKSKGHFFRGFLC